MTDQTDAEFIAEMKALAKEATKQVEAYGASAPLLKFANAARTAIPRLIGMVEAEKKRADDSDAALAMANSLYAESELHVIHRAEIRHILADHDRVCKERDALRINAVDDAFVKRIMEMPDAELLASVEPGEIDLNKQLFKTAKMQVERDAALAEVARMREALVEVHDMLKRQRPLTAEEVAKDALASKE
jgi:hypothetical protein